MARTKVPLRVGGLAERRSGTSDLKCGGFSNMIGMLKRTFTFTEMETLKDLTTDALSGLDVFILCTTEGPELSDAEVTALRAWVEAGGALIVSAFSNWSPYRHFAAKTVGWLGLETVPHAAFKDQATYILEHVASEAGVAVQSELLMGPFGHVDRFANMGESIFKVLDAALHFGAVPLTRPELEQSKSTLVFYPPSIDRAEGVTGKGRVLVCSNYHWIADEAHWGGGLLAFRNRSEPATFNANRALRPNQALLLNFIAGALAARAGGRS